MAADREPRTATPTRRFRRVRRILGATVFSRFKGFAEERERLLAQERAEDEARDRRPPEA